MNEWTSAAAVDGAWQMCLKCKKKATPYYLREHDRREDEIEKEEEGKANPPAKANPPTKINPKPNS